MQGRTDGQSSRLMELLARKSLLVTLAQNNSRLAKLHHTSSRTSRARPFYWQKGKICCAFERCCAAGLWRSCLKTKHRDTSCWGCKVCLPVGSTANMPKWRGERILVRGMRTTSSPHAMMPMPNPFTALEMNSNSPEAGFRTRPVVPMTSPSPAPAAPPA